MHRDSVQDLLDAHVRLRVAALARHAAFVPSARAEESVRAKLEPLHREGTVRAAEKDGRPVAVLAWRHDESPWYGAPVSSVAIDYELAFESASAWLGSVLDEELPRMEADLDLLLDVSYATAFRALRARGVGVSSLQLLGEPERALERLVRSSDPSRDLTRFGVELAPLEPSRIDDAIELTRAIFTAHPEHCWFGATEGSLARMRDMLAIDLARDDHLQRALLRGGALLGHVSASVRDDPCFGPTAGMSLALAPELRGRGIARPLYRHLLEGMIERGARTFRGGTSQPAVIRIGAELGRPLHAIVMRRRTYFEDAWFAPYALPG